MLRLRYETFHASSLKVMLSVNDQEEMGVQLLTIGGQRVAWEIFKRDIDQNFQHLAGMSTSLTRWLKELVSLSTN